MNLFAVSGSLAQTANTDTAFVKPYSQKILLVGYVSTNSLEMITADKKYMPNNPLNLGAGISVKNTVINMIFDYGLFPLKGKAYGKTKLTDFQIHNYRKHLVLDLFIQRYKGFYDPLSVDRGIVSYPDLSVSQIGGEGTYVFNGNKFSVRAAFEQSEKQLKSAGSFLLGGGVYFQKIGLDSMMLINGRSPINNFQTGLNLGYGYSWVINNRWQLSGIAKIGANLEVPKALTRPFGAIWSIDLCKSEVGCVFTFNCLA